jgi:hypothetical protein
MNLRWMAAVGHKLVLCAGFQLGTGFEIASAKITVSAQRISMHTFYSRIGLDTFGGAASALGAFEGIDLPYIVLPGSRSLQGKSSGAHHRNTQGQPDPVVDEITAAVPFILLLHDRVFLGLRATGIATGCGIPCSENHRCIPGRASTCLRARRIPATATNAASRVPLPNFSIKPLLSIIV